jgi:hypothetical protein
MDKREFFVTATSDISPRIRKGDHVLIHSDRTPSCGLVSLQSAAWLLAGSPRRSAMAKKTHGAAAAGYQLALKLLQDVRAQRRSGVCHFEAELREGLPQLNLVAEYLERVRSLQSSEAETAFAAMLTEFIASGVEGYWPSDPDACYRHAVRERLCADAAQSDQPFQRFIETATSEANHG